MRRLDRIEKASELRALVEGDALHRVSIYVAADHAPDAPRAGPLRLRSALERAEVRLRERGVSSDRVGSWMQHLEAAASLEGLHHSTRTLALFGDDAGCAWAGLAEAIDPQVVVSPCFALRPLLRALRAECAFRVLAVSANRIAAYEGDARSLRPVRVEGLPASLEDALGSELDGAALSCRGARVVPGSSRLAPVFHGHGGADDERARDRTRFHRALASALESAWGGSSVPVVLAAEVRTATELREAAALPALLDAEIRGNPDSLAPEELHARALALVREELAARMRRELESGFERRFREGKVLEREIGAVGEAAIAGRIGRLWVEEEARVPGRLDPTSGAFAAPLGDADPDEDALDALVGFVLRRGGEVQVVASGETPTGAAWCAELR